MCKQSCLCSVLRHLENITPLGKTIIIIIFFIKHSDRYTFYIYMRYFRHSVHPTPWYVAPVKILTPTIYNFGNRKRVVNDSFTGLYIYGGSYSGRLILSGWLYLCKFSVRECVLLINLLDLNQTIPVAPQSSLLETTGLRLFMPSGFKSSGLLSGLLLTLYFSCIYLISLWSCNCCEIKWFTAVTEHLGDYTIQDPPINMAYSFIQTPGLMKDNCS